MDDSLSDFQEKKKFASAKDTKTVQKPSTSKAKPNKNIKKIRGQKDIRAVLKKKNELIAYSNDFDKICRLSGIDVDSEQLQLAIALSKSLQKTDEKAEEESASSGSSTTQERTGKIRTTLQEYGFVVPDIKITAPKTRKLKKYRNNYKLLQVTEAEKQQIISDKYSQVLFDSLDNNKDTNSSDFPNKSKSELYHIGTNISYQEIKDDKLLYVENLLEKSPSFVGCLLKNWSEIPGRPVSPTLETFYIQFEKINCTKEELDIVLSGHVKTAQEIVKNKCSLIPVEDPVKTINKTENISEELKMDADCIEILEPEDANAKNKSGIFRKDNQPIEIMDVESSNFLAIAQNIRSGSPDIFDEEVSEILESPNKKTDIPCQKQLYQNISKAQTWADVMDLTECVNINSQTTIIKPTPLLSQGNHTIKRRSNDFMDITECVVGSSQPIRENIIEENIDLTQHSDDDDDNVVVTERVTKEKEIQSLDLTQSSDTDEELPFVQLSGNKYLDDTIILNEEAYSGYKTANLETKNCEESYCNSKNISFTKELHSPKHLSTHNNTSVTMESEDESDNHTNMQNKNVEVRAISPIHCVSNNSVLDFPTETVVANRKSIKASKNITQEHSKSVRHSDGNITKSKTESFFEEFVHRHSSSSKENSNEILFVDEPFKNSAYIDNCSRNENEDIDLTQLSDTPEETTKPVKKIDSPKISFDSSNLGKIDNVSIDYDELFDDVERSKATSTSHSKSTSSRSHNIDFYNENTEKPSNSDLVSNSSQNSEAFEISDKELDYSIHKSRLDVENPVINFDFGGISVVDNLPDLPSFRPSTSNIENKSLNRSMSDGYLPMVDIKGNNEYESKIKSSSSLYPTTSKTLNEGKIAKTPKNGEYIIKTDGVTPMLDYEKMSSPERNAELDKYGLKPFKRKRAIQLLTHLYNQTHPIVESIENLPSPSKRFKPDLPTSPIKINSPRKTPEVLKSPTKCSKSSSDSKKVTKQREDDDIAEIAAIDKENEVYDVTSDVPNIRDIECCEEDWVFQKREKAKVHSCRVPLHIAFHNYVSARQSLREAILRYEPVNIDDIHKGLVSIGFRYDPKDLLKFMDKKCITVKTADNNGRKNCGAPNKIGIANKAPDQINADKTGDLYSELVQLERRALVVDAVPENCGAPNKIDIANKAPDQINADKTGDLYSELVQLERRALVVNAEPFECGVCMGECAAGAGAVLRECLHTFCTECLSDLVKHCEEPVVGCPAMLTNVGCPGVLQEREIRALVTPQEYERWLARGLAAAESGTRNAFHCRTRDCTGWALCDPGVLRFPCPVCKHDNCIPCQAIHEGETCEQYKKKLQEAALPRSSQADERTEAHLNELINSGKAMACPECSAIITKDGGCDSVICSACRTEICWATRGRRWGPGGRGDTSGGCRCRVRGKRCHPKCRNCH